MKFPEPSPELNDLSNRVIGCVIEVHRTLGPGFLESTYESALAIELSLQGIPFSRQHPIELKYKGHTLGEGRLDILVDNQLILELKAVDSIHPIHKAQVISYLKATGFILGLLINFNVTTMNDGIRRLILSK